MSQSTHRSSRWQSKNSQQGYCIGVSRRCAQATAGKRLAKGPYVAARAGVEPTTLRLKVIVSTKAPPCPTLCAKCCICEKRVEHSELNPNQQLKNGQKVAVTWK